MRTITAVLVGALLWPAGVTQQSDRVRTRNSHTLPTVMIAIESEAWSEVLDTRNDRIAEASVTPKAPGRIRLRIATICNAPRAGAFLRVTVTR